MKRHDSHMKQLLSQAMNDGIGKIPFTSESTIRKRNLKSSRFSLRYFVIIQTSSRFSLCCFVINAYNRLLKSRVTKACMWGARGHWKAVVHFLPLWTALIWTSVVSSPSPDTLNMPGYTLAASDKESIDPKYLCNSCGLLLREATRTACGHFYCRSCLVM